ncbi:hypothetical protein [Nostoc sp.]|uniref:hypothetical protein n=1 Tax=Nostoc sp. TaxID=1180 RepID=UPI003594642F
MRACAIKGGSMRSPIASRRASHLPSPLTIPIKQVSQLTREILRVKVGKQRSHFLTQARHRTSSNGNPGNSCVSHSHEILKPLRYRCRPSPKILRGKVAHLRSDR